MREYMNTIHKINNDIYLIILIAEKIANNKTSQAEISELKGKLSARVEKLKEKYVLLKNVDTKDA